MRRTWTLAAVLLLGTAAAAHAAEIPIDRLSLNVPSGREVRVDFPVGEFRVEPATGSKVTFDLTAKCKRWTGEDCEDRTDRIRVETEDAGGVLRIRIKGFPKMNSHGFSLRGVLRVPRDLALRVDMGVGDLDIADIHGDLDVELGVGDADIRTASRAVRSVEVATGVGDASVIAEGHRVRRRAFISSAASWDEGRGQSRVNLNVGVGDATVRVD